MKGRLEGFASCSMMGETTDVQEDRIMWSRS